MVKIGKKEGELYEGNKINNSITSVNYDMCI